MKQDLVVKYVLMSIGFVQLSMLAFAICTMIINLV